MKAIIGFKSKNIIKLISSICLILVISQTAFSQIIHSQWAKSVGGTLEENSYCVENDSLGNVFSAGYFYSNLDFGGGITLANSGGEDLFLAKYDNKGKCIWAKNAIGAGNDEIRGLKTTSAGYSYVTGYFESSIINFGNGITLTNSGNKDIFLAKYDANGNCLWAVKAGNSGYDFSYGIATDASENVYITGVFCDSVNFGNGKYLIGTDKAISDIFIAKYHKNGTCLMVTSAGGIGQDHANDIQVDNSGNIFITGYFENLCYFGSNSVYTPLQCDAYIAKFDNTGYSLWVKQFGGTIDDYGKSVTVDEFGNSYIVGTSEGNIDFGNGLPLISKGDHDAFIAKYDDMGNCLWSNNAGGLGWDGAYGIELKNNLIYVVGYFYESADFGNVNYISSNGATDIFLAEYNNLGICQRVKGAGGTLEDFGYDISLRNINEIYVTGYIQSSAMFDTTELISAGGSDLFISRYRGGALQVKIDTVQPVSCNGLCDGFASVSAVGGMPPFSYSWSSIGSTNPNVSGLCAGKYFVTVTDANSNVATDSIFISEPTKIVVTSKIIENVKCFASTDGSIKVKVAGGVQPYAFNWSNGSNTDSIGNLSAGLYVLTLRDSLNCELIDTNKVIQPSNIVPNVGKIEPTCNGLSDGTLSIDATGGTAPYTYLWFNDSTQSTIFGLSAGTYLVTITDANSCERTKTAILNDPAKLVSSFSLIMPSCFGLSNGSAVVEVTGGTSPYTFVWNNDSSSVMINNMSAGQYSVSVTDSKGCMTNNSFVLNQPLQLKDTIALVKPASCDGSANGGTIISGLGGNPPYTYLWQDGQIGNVASNLVFGSYFFTITDSKNCTVTNKVNIPELGKSKLYGTVKFSNGFIAKSDAEVTLIKASVQPFKEFKKMDIGDNGTFEFDSVDGGKYVLNVKLYDHAFQKYPGVMQTYYDKTHKWQLAKIIDINCESSDTILVEMFENPSAEVGKGTIKGNINYALNGNKSIMGEPVPGAEIAVEQEPDDMPIMQTSSKDDGSYVFTDVPTGVFSLSIDIPGIPQISTHSIILSDNDLTYDGLNFIVDTGVTTLGITTDTLTSAPIILSENIHLSVYPNPANDFITIDYKLEQKANISIELINIEGKILETQTLENQLNENSIKLNIEKLEAGTYFVKFESENNVYVKKILVE